MGRLRSDPAGGVADNPVSGVGVAFAGGPAGAVLGIFRLPATPRFGHRPVAFHPDRRGRDRRARRHSGRHSPRSGLLLGRSGHHCRVDGAGGLHGAGTADRLGAVASCAGARPLRRWADPGYRAFGARHRRFRGAAPGQSSRRAAGGALSACCGGTNRAVHRQHRSALSPAFETRLVLQLSSGSVDHQRRLALGHLPALRGRYRCDVLHRH